MKKIIILFSFLFMFFASNAQIHHLLSTEDNLIQNLTNSFKEKQTRLQSQSLNRFDNQTLFNESRQTTGNNNCTNKSYFNRDKSLVWKPDTIIYYDTVASQYRITFTRDGNGNFLNYLFEKWGSGAWVNRYKLSCTYDGNGNVSTQLKERWQGGAWANYVRHYFTYDGNGNMLTDSSEAWYLGSWVNGYINSFSYDSDGNILTRLKEQWQSGALVNYDKNDYSYDNSGNMLTDTFKIWQNGVWENWRNYSYAYDSNGIMINEFYEYWQSGTWITSYKCSYIYDGNGNRINEYYEVLQSGVWVNIANYSYTYDGNGNSVTGTYEAWINNAWQPVADILDLYTGKSKFVDNYYDDDVFSCSSYVASWKSYTVGINEIKIDDGSVQLYPNPANEKVTIDFNGKGNNNFISIYDCNGQLLLKQSIVNGNLEIDISSLAKGLYFIKLTTAEGSVVKKFVKE